MECTSEFQTGALTGLRPSNPLGVKGAGEGAIIPVGGLMANAVANALASLGAMPNQLPLSPARVWLLGSIKKSVGRAPITSAAILSQSTPRSWSLPPRSR